MSLNLLLGPYLKHDIVGNNVLFKLHGLFHEKVSDLGNISHVESEKNNIVYVQEINSFFEYKNEKWQQCGKEMIIRKSLALGSLHVEHLEIGV